MLLIQLLSNVHVGALYAAVRCLKVLPSCVIFAQQPQISVNDWASSGFFSIHVDCVVQALLSINLL